MTAFCENINTLRYWWIISHIPYVWCNNDHGTVVRCSTFCLLVQARVVASLYGYILLGLHVSHNVAHGKNGQKSFSENVIFSNFEERKLLFSYLILSLSSISIELDKKIGPVAIGCMGSSLSCCWGSFRWQQTHRQLS